MITVSYLLNLPARIAHLILPYVVILSANFSYAQTINKLPLIYISDNAKVSYNMLKADPNGLSVRDQIARLLQIPFYQQHLPKKWSIIFTESLPPNVGGLHHHRHTDPDGNPTVFLSPQNLLVLNNWSPLAHETFHLIHSIYRPHEEPWLREGLALTAETIFSESLVPYFEMAYDVPTVSLIRPINWNNRSAEETQLRLSHYAHLQLFFLYIYNNCGGLALLEPLTTSLTPEKGVPFLKNILSALAAVNAGLPTWKPYCQNLNQLHEQFQKAKYQPRFDLSDGFLVKNPNLRARILEDRPTGKLPPYSAVAYFAKPNTECPADTRALSSTVCLKIQND